MKKQFLFSILFFLAVNAIAQDLSFFSSKWKILEIKNIYRNGNISKYHRDSTKNEMDFGKYEIKYSVDGSYKGTSLSGDSFNGIWSITTKKDSVTIDRSSYRIQLLNSNLFTMRSYSFQLADTVGGLDTVYTDFTMYSIPDITTSLYESAIGNENVKVFPNPVKDILEIKWTSVPVENVVNIRLSNTMGQMIKNYNTQKSVTSFSIDMSDLYQGVYTLEAINSEGKRVAIKKVVKE